ncbi:MAG TPA: hypothetical protein VIU64_13660 [Polyangia bacterium]
MFKLVKLLAGLVGLAAFVWFGANVPLGSQTLFQHLQAIGRTRETQDLLDGTREKAKPLVDSVRRKLAQEATVSPGAPDAGAAAVPSDEIPESDRQRLKKLLAGEAGERSNEPHSTRRTPLR